MSRIKLCMVMLLCCGFISSVLTKGISDYQIVDATTAKTFDVCGPDDYEVVVELESIGDIKLVTF